MDELLTTEEILTELKISRSTLNRLLASGQLQAYQIGESGSSLRFKTGDVAAMLQPRRPSRAQITRGPMAGPGRPMKYG